MNLSNLFSVNFKDFVNGLLTAIVGAIITYLYGVFDALYQLVLNGQPFKIEVDLQVMLVIGAFAGLSYIVRRYFSDAQGSFLGNSKA